MTDASLNRKSAKQNLLSGIGARLQGFLQSSRNIDASQDKLTAMQKQLDRIEQTLTQLQGRLSRMEAFSHGGRTTYMGDGLVLIKAIVNGIQIIYLVEAEDRLIAPWFIATGLYETELTEHFGRILRKDDHCLDIGANFGYFTLLFGRFCPQGKSIGVEADETLFKIARDNIHINDLGRNTSIYHYAICETERELTLFRRVGRSGNTSIFKVPEGFLDYLGEAPSVEFSIKGVSIDQFSKHFEGKLDIIKIDIEGAEPLAFAGAQSVIAANPDLQIMMEWSPGQIQAAGFDVGEFLNNLSRSGLRFHRLDASLTELTAQDLLSIPYTAGILLAKRPRLAA
ncbi:MAG: FkbM family methyltransferase [Roseomonas sp.]|nr:FkbM family methyltransferase [Roseomonas sp.]